MFPAQALPFILSGVGIDSVFVLVAALDEVTENHPELRGDIPTRMRLMMQIGGPSVTVSALTDISAFLLGSVTSLPAIRWFCWQATLGVLLNYLLQMSAFVALLTLSERRKAANRYEILCCY